MRSYHESMLQVKGLDTTCIMIPNQSQTTQAIEPQFKEAIHSITKSINLNLSACYVRLEKWEKCADLTKKILSEDKDSIKVNCNHLIHIISFIIIFSII